MVSAHPSRPSRLLLCNHGVFFLFQIIFQRWLGEEYYVYMSLVYQMNVFSIIYEEILNKAKNSPI